MKEIKSMNLNEFLAQGPTAVAEIENIKTAAAEAAVAPINARMTKCAALLASDVYAGNAPVRIKVCACLKGDISVDALDAIIEMVDMLAKPAGGAMPSDTLNFAQRRHDADGIVALGAEL